MFPSAVGARDGSINTPNRSSLGDGATIMPEDTLKEALESTRRAAKELAEASARLAKRAVSKAEVAGRDPSGSAKKVARRVAKELDAAAKEVERILKDL